MITEAEVGRIATSLPAHSYVRQYVTYALRVSDAPLAFQLGVALSHLATVVHRDLHFRLTTRTRPNLFVLNVGPSGSRKSQAIMLGDEILHPIVNDRAAETPGSWEGLEEGLADHPVQLHEYDEFGDFLHKTSTAAGGSYFSKIRQTYTKLFDCRDYKRRKAQRKIVKVQDPRLSILGGSTPEYVERYTDHEDWCGGFMGRFLTFYAQRERTDTETLIWDEQADWLRQKLGSLYLMGHNTDTPFPYIYQGRTEAAQALWVEWYQALNARAQSANEWAQSALSRLPVNALKVATLLAMDYGQVAGDDPDPSDPTTITTTPLSPYPWQLDVDALRPAIEIVELSYRSTLSIIDRLASSPYEIVRRNVLGAFRDEDALPVWKIMRRLKPKLRLRTLQEALESLQAAKEVTRVDGSLGTEPLYRRRYDTPTEAPTPENVIPLRVPEALAPTTAANEPDEPEQVVNWDDYLT